MLYLLKLNHSFAIEWRDLFHFDFTIQKRILTVGIPFAAEQLFFNGGKLLTQTFVVQLGTLSMTCLLYTSFINCQNDLYVFQRLAH